MMRSTTYCAHPASVTRMIFPCRHHFQADNKQEYSHAVKLPEDRFRQIRLSGVSQLSGSVPRTRNKQSGNICCRALCHGAGGKHYIQEKWQLSEWHILCFRAAARRGGSGGSGTRSFRICEEGKTDYCRRVTNSDVFL